jgi:hypothetical protein
MSVNCNLGRYALLARRTDYFNDFAGGLLNPVACSTRVG